MQSKKAMYFERTGNRKILMHIIPKKHSLKMSNNMNTHGFYSFSHLRLKSDAPGIFVDSGNKSDEVRKEIVPVKGIDMNKHETKNEKSDWLNRPKDHPIIYMKGLDPNLCIAFNTERGRNIFKRAIQGKYMNLYFQLSQHFHTQTEANFCAISTLAMILNALKVDPRRMWRYPWRWYDEYMLNSCIDLEEIKASGCSFDTLACIARCNKLSVEAVRVSSLTSVSTLRNDVRRACVSYDSAIVVNYAREAFNQTGTGHFTPIGGYDEKEDMVLLLDTARFKYPPHWVSLDLLFESMAQIARASSGYTKEMPRGYHIVKKNESNPSITLKFPNEFTLKLEPMNKSRQPEIETLLKVFNSWDSWLDIEVNNENDIIQSVVKKIIDISRSMDRIEKADVPTLHVLQESSYTDISSTVLFKWIEKALVKLPVKDGNSILLLVEWLMQMFRPSECTDMDCCTLQSDNKNQIEYSAKSDKSLSLAKALSFLILFWPYRVQNDDQLKQSNRAKLQTIVSDDLKNFPKNLVSTTHQQLRFIMKTLSHVGHEKIHCKEEHYFD